MARRPRRNHSAAFKAMVALAAIRAIFGIMVAFLTSIGG